MAQSITEKGLILTPALEQEDTKALLLSHIPHKPAAVTTAAWLQRLCLSKLKQRHLLLKENMYVQNEITTHPLAAGRTNSFWYNLLLQAAASTFLILPACMAYLAWLLGDTTTPSLWLSTPKASENPIFKSTY